MKCVNIEDIAKEYERLLGHNFDVEINANLDYTKKKIQVCVYPTRRPYKVKGINSEVIEVYMEIYIPITLAGQKDAWLNHINKVVNGLQEGEFESNGDTWSYCSTLDFTRALMPPQVDSGKIMQLVSLQGQILVSASDGAMISGDVKYSLSFNEGDIEYSGEIRVLQKTTQIEKQPEATPLSTETFAGAFNRTQSVSYNFVILVLKDRLHKRLVEAIECFKPLEINQLFKVNYDCNTLDIHDSKTMVLTNGEIQENAGAFSTLALTFMIASSVILEE